MAKHIILGATGHVGSAVVHNLLDRGETVVAVVHDAAKAGNLRERGADIVAVDLHDCAALRAIFRRGDRAFLLNPPAAPNTDTDAEERHTVAAILAALDGSGLAKVVAASTYGAAAGEAVGDLSVLYEFEQALAAQSIPAAINRAAYYFTNWDVSLQTARDQGVVHTPYPADFVLPMVDPVDLGHTAAARLLSDTDDVGIHYVEGPARYTPQDVAEMFAALIGRPVRIETVPRDQIEAMFLGLGFSPAAARAYRRMTEATLDHVSWPDAAERGTRTLWNYLAELISRPS